MDRVVVSPKTEAEEVPGCFLDFRKKFLPNEAVSQYTLTPSVADTVKAGTDAKSGAVVSWTTTGGTLGDVLEFHVKSVGSLGSTEEAVLVMAVV